jgi:hypothetical protein
VFATIRAIARQLRFERTQPVAIRFHQQQDIGPGSLDQRGGARIVLVRLKDIERKNLGATHPAHLVRQRHLRGGKRRIGPHTRQIDDCAGCEQSHRNPFAPPGEQRGQHAQKGRKIDRRLAHEVKHAHDPAIGRPQGYQRERQHDCGEPDGDFRSGIDLTDVCVPLMTRAP